VDDDAATRDLLTLLLTQSARARVGSLGRPWQRSSMKCPPLALADIGMPEEDGLSIDAPDPGAFSWMRACRVWRCRRMSGRRRGSRRAAGFDDVLANHRLVLHLLVIILAAHRATSNVSLRNRFDDLTP
jgi:hypothetical protein